MSAGDYELDDGEGAPVVDLDAARAAAGQPRGIDLTAAMRALKPGMAFCDVPARGWKDAGFFDDTGCLPKHCPVKPLGYDGNTFFFLDTRGTVQGLTPSNVNKGHIDALFSGFAAFVVWAWGQKVWDKKRKEWIDKDNYDAEKCRVDLFAACHAKGPWNEVERVRGRGAWREDDGTLVLHTGRELLIGGFEPHPCGERNGFVYPKRPPVPAPADKRQPAAADDAAHEILTILESWSWARPEIDPLLMLGWIAGAPMGGALRWRPVTFVTGDMAVGKSTLQGLIKNLLGAALQQAAETTAAGIYQSVQQDSTPVAVDELEAESDPRKALAVVKLARLAASGGRMLRGGQDHHGTAFNLYNMFLFSAINAPALHSQDRTRMACLNLRPLKERKATAAWADAAQLAEWGRELQRRMIDWFGPDRKAGAGVARWDILLETFRRALIEQAGHDGRGADTFGTLAALAHAALNDAYPTAGDLKFWTDRLARRALSEFEDAVPNWKIAWGHLLQAQPDAFRNLTAKSVGALLHDYKRGRGEDTTSDTLRLRLSQVGLGLSFPRGVPKKPENALLFVPNRHPALNAIYQGTQYAGVGGASGVWTDALRGAPEDYWSQGTGRIDGKKERGTLFWLDKMDIGEAEKEQDDDGWTEE